MLEHYAKKEGNSSQVVPDLNSQYRINADYGLIISVAYISTISSYEPYKVPTTAQTVLFV